jgi:hypothetical protein
LIGISKVEDKELKFQYAPFDEIICEDTLGIYLLNNTKAVSWIKDKNEIDKIFKDYHADPNSTSERIKHKKINSKPKSPNKFDTEEMMVDGDSNIQYPIYEEKKEHEHSQNFKRLRTAQVAPIQELPKKNFNKTKDFPKIEGPKASKNDFLATPFSVLNIITTLDKILTQKLDYKVNLKTDVSDSNVTTLVGKVENHILI